MALHLIHQIKRMPSKGRYTAGKQVSRYEADSENIDIEYKNLEGQGQGATCSGCSCPFGDKKTIVIKVLTVTIVFGIGLVLGFLIRKSVYSEGGRIQNMPNRSNIYIIKQDYDPVFSRLIQADLEEVYNYEDHMKIITRCIHMSGVGSANKLLDYVEQKWRTFPFDAVKVKRYNVTLSYPNYTNMDANIVTVQAANGTLIFRSEYNTSSSHPEYLPFSAYSPSGNVTTTKVVYGHYARVEDLEKLSQSNVSVKGAILVVRYGHIHPASKVKNAERYGAVGVILYSDPADYAGNQSAVYPDSWWLPGWAVQLAHVRYNLLGDPATPDYSSITGVHHFSEVSSHFPKIPVQPIRYADARFVLSNMRGPVVENGWFGGLNITYRLGPGYTDNRSVSLVVDNMIQERNISNILAVVKGQYEPDRYVIVGAHIDSWIQGAVDAGTGYTVIQELARTFAYHIGQGWKPRRTIILALWDASKYGNIGSYEWVQEYEQQLFAGAVAYINLDAVIQGNYSFTAAASPVLATMIMNATQTVELNCTDIPGCDKSWTVFQQWTHSFPDSNGLPKLKVMGDSSDHSPFIYRLGVPIICPQFTFNETNHPSLSTYPAVGALEDTKDYVEQFIDPDYTLHITMAKVLADVILRLSDSAVLPYDLQGLIHTLQSGRQTLLEAASILKAFGTELDGFSSALEAVDRLCLTLADLRETINKLDRSELSEFDLYTLNNKLLHLTRAFISEVGLPENKHYKNMLLAPDPVDLQNELIFPGIAYTAHQSYNRTQTVELLSQQMSLLVYSLNKAADILNDAMVT